MSILLDIITPTNLAEEEERFLSSKRYNPEFRFNWSKKYRDRGLKESSKRRQLYNAIYEQHIDAITHLAAETFQVQIDHKILKKAENLTVYRFPQKPIEEFSELVHTFEKAFYVLNLPYHVEVSKKGGFFARPDHTKRHLLLSRHVNLQFFSVDGLVKHELTHIIRAVNTKYNQITYGTVYLPTEEGLCSYVQDYYGAYGNLSLFQHAAEYVASSVGINGSLRDVYEFFRSIGFNPHLAWARAARHKFGFVNTADRGDIMKPAMYFYHEELIRQLTQHELWKLFVGKIPLSRVDEFVTYQGQLHLEDIQEFYRKNWAEPHMYSQL